MKSDQLWPQLRARLVTLPAAAEFAIVTLCGFGYFIYGNLYDFVAAAPQQPLDADDIWFLIIFEAIVLCFIGVLLAVRGWTGARLGLIWHRYDWLATFGLIVGIMLVNAVVRVTIMLATQRGIPPPIAPGLSLWAIAAVSLINPIFEEVLLAGYMVTALERRLGTWTAIAISVTIRAVCHLYQGSIGVVSIAIFGLILTYWFARNRRLWPLILAHSFFDLSALLLYTLLTPPG